MSSIAVWNAVRFEGVMPRGRTRPLIIGCERQRGSQTLRDVYVVKAVGNHPEVSPDLLCNELLGHMVARTFGCRTFEFALVDLSPEFIQANNEVFAREGVSPTPGLAFATQRAEHVMPFGGRQPILPKEMLQAAARVFAVDMVLQNPDRREDNHNCGTLNNDIVLWDFDQAFGFRYPILGGTPKCWEICKLSFRRQHVFYSSLRGKPIDWNWVAAVTTSVSDSVDGWYEALPDPWRHGAEPLLKAVSDIAPHRVELVRELQMGLV